MEVLASSPILPRGDKDHYVPGKSLLQELCDDLESAVIDPSSVWTLADAYFQNQPQRLTLMAQVGDCACVKIIFEPWAAPNNGSLGKRLIELYRNGSLDSSKKHAWTVDQVFALCRKKYQQALLLFGSMLYLRMTARGLDIVEQIDLNILPVLKNNIEMFGVELDIPTVSRSNLRPILQGGGLLPAQTRLVEYLGQYHVAKGPLYPEKAMLDLNEVKNLISLPHRHPNIIDPPTTLITVSQLDTRICGFLTPYHQNGNLECYARKLRAQRKLTPRLLYKWTAQLISAVVFLAQAGTWHGDIKPDNVLVSNDEDLVLIDFTRVFTTFATASPEVRAHCLPYKGGFSGIPSDWPLSKVLPSEVYSIGRTMYLVSEGISMPELYREKGWINDCEFPITFLHHSLAPEDLRSIIRSCVQEDPLNRPSLDTLSLVLEAARGAQGP